MHLVNLICEHAVKAYSTIYVNLIVSFQMSVEVERKFLCNADILKTLEEIGGMC